MPDILKLKMSEVNQFIDEIKELKVVNFETMADAIIWIERNGGTVYRHDENECYIDFNYGHLSATFSKREDGYWRLTDLIEVYDDNGDVIFEIELEA